MQTLPEFLADVLREPCERAFGERLGAAQWEYTSTTEMRRRASALAYGLREAGLEAGDRVGLIANNRIDWLAADFGILFAGCVVVPIFATLALDQVDYIMGDCAAKLCFVETAKDAERIRAACPHAPRLIHFDGEGPDSLEAFEAAGAAAAAAHPSRLPSFTLQQTPDELAVLIYTSGTTGNPKGVVLTHQNLVHNAVSSAESGLARLRPGEAVLSVLPFAHIFEHCALFAFLTVGAELFITQPEYLLEDLKAVRPRVMALVPRIFERVLASIVTRAKEGGAVRARLVPWALAVGREFATARVERRRPSFALRAQYALARRLVLAKIPPALGLDRLDYFVSGSAALHRDIALTFAGLGIRICEGYGLTETSPVVTVNRFDDLRYGSVGKPIRGVEVRIAGDGEILVKGPSVMKGYYNLPGEQPFTEDGWFRTGDIGAFDEDGFLFITDRKKELIKTTAGKYVAPSRVEAALKRSVYVGQCFIVGDGRPHPIALVAPSWQLIRDEFGLPHDLSPAVIAEREDVRTFIEREVAENTADLGPFEQIRRVALLPRDLTIEDGELSPTLKVKRRVVERKFAAIIESAYSGNNGARRKG
ncbi:MAG: long-chain fatty acid--CoA ligase [Candidatus Baltobacteraceae bacterium]|jgi:long-chain acyl-CoA synthetase